MKKTWYQMEGSKTKEFISILHIPYTLMCLSFLTIGFAIEGISNWYLYSLGVTAYFLGLGVSSHCFDQLQGMGSRYVKFLKDETLISIGLYSFIISVSIGIFVMLHYEAWGLILLIPLQSFFVFSYPASKLFKGVFHTDFWFSVSFGAIPVVVGDYINTLGFSIVSLWWALLAFLISYIEINLSRYVRTQRKNDFYQTWYYEKPEFALKLLCAMSYLLALIMVFSH